MLRKKMPYLYTYTQMRMYICVGKHWKKIYELNNVIFLLAVCKELEENLHQLDQLGWSKSWRYSSKLVPNEWNFKMQWGPGFQFNKIWK